MSDFFKGNIRKITNLLIIGLFTFQFSGKVNQVVKGESTCVCAYDGYGYYMYLTQFFQYRNLTMQQNELQQVQDKYCDGVYVYQLKRMDTGHDLDIYHMGQAYLQLPAYTIGHVFAKTLGYPKDGFSKPYHITYLLNALLFILLGIHFLNKILKRFFSDKTSSLVLLIVYFGTNFWATAIHSYQLQHIYLFALIAMLFHYLLKFKEVKEKKTLLVAALILGLISSIRPTHVLLGLLPLLMLRKVYPTSWGYWKSILWFPLAGLLFNLPQLIYWKILGGSWFILNMHVEEIVIVDPKLFDFLFSYKKGWLLYSPIFLLIIPGFFQLYRHKKELFWPILSVLFTAIWFFSSWECWWYAASFGSRVMVDLYPLLIVPLGFALVYLQKSKPGTFFMLIFVGLTTVLSIFQSVQYSNGYLHPDRMTKAHYWYIFGKSSMPDYQMNRLEIDRSDLSWPEQIKAEELHFGKISKVTFCEVKNKRIPGKGSTLLVKMPYFPKLKTDETLFEAQMVYQIKDSLNTGTIKFEAFSKYCTYNWNYFPLTTKKKLGESDTLTVRFNCPILYHSEDKIQIYVVNPSSKEIFIQDLKIQALSLRRK